MSDKFQNSDIITKLKEVDRIWEQMEDADTKIFELKESSTQKLNEIKVKRISMELELCKNIPRVPSPICNQTRIKTGDYEPSKGNSLALFIAALCYVLPWIALFLGVLSIVLFATGAVGESTFYGLGLPSFMILVFAGIARLGLAKGIMEDFRDKVDKVLTECSPDSDNEDWETFFDKCIAFDAAYENHLTQIVSYEKEFAKTATGTNNLFAENEALIKKLEKELKKYTFISPDDASSAWRIAEIMESEGTDYETALKKAIKELDDENDSSAEDEMDLKEAIRIIIDNLGG